MISPGRAHANTICRVVVEFPPELIPNVASRWQTTMDLFKNHIAEIWFDVNCDKDYATMLPQPSKVTRSDCRVAANTKNPEQETLLSSRPDADSVNLRGEHLAGIERHRFLKPPG